MSTGQVTPRRSLRTSLTLLLVALMLLACLVVGLVTILTVRSFLINKLDQQLALAGTRYAVSLEHPGTAAAEPETATVGQSVGTLGSRLMHGHITAVGVISDPGRPVRVSAADRQMIQALSADHGPQTVTLPDLGTYRLQVVQGRDGDVLITGLPEESVRDTTQFLIVIMGAVFLIVILAVAAIAAVAVRKSLRPLERVAATVRHVSELPLASGYVAIQLDRPTNLPNPRPAPRTEVARVSGAVDLLLTRLQEALTQRQHSEDRIKKFVADASHELRTPLAVVRSHVELIERSTETVPESMLDSVAHIEVGTRRMTRLVDDLLLLARLDTGAPLERHEVDLTRVVLDAVSEARRAGRAHRWTLDLPEEPVLVRGDEYRLHQVLMNLLTNARVHTPAGVHITTTLKMQTPGSVELTVTDDGPGIGAELLPRIGQRFVRGPGPRRQTSGGTGLGLSIVVGIVAAHQGVFTVRSRPGNTVMAVTLPELGANAFTTSADGRSSNRL